MRKSSQFTYNHFVNAMGAVKKQKQTPKLMAAFGPSSYLKLKLEDWFHGRSGGQPIETLNADSLKKADYDALFFQDSIFHSQCYYVIRGAEKKSELASSLKGVRGPESLSNSVLVLSGTRALPAPLKKELTRLEAQLIPCYEPNQYELERFLSSLGTRHGLQLSTGAVRSIISAIGGDLFKLENELKKLSLIFPDSQELSDKDITPYLDFVREEHAFKLDDCIIGGRFAQAQSLLHHLLQRGESHLAILGILTHHCRKALMVKNLAQENKGLKEIGQATGMPFSVVKRFLPYAQRQAKLKLSSTLFQCQEADIIFKSSSIDSEMILSDILLSLAKD